MINKIAVCRYCNTPLIYTFIFPGSEWYCINCGSDIPLLNAHRIEETPKLKRKKIENQKQFSHITKDIIPYKSYKHGCKKCDKGEHHLKHATEEEKEKSKQIYIKLRKGTLKQND